MSGWAVRVEDSSITARADNRQPNWLWCDTAVGPWDTDQVLVYPSRQEAERALSKAYGPPSRRPKAGYRYTPVPVTEGIPDMRCGGNS